MILYKRIRSLVGAAIAHFLLVLFDEHDAEGVSDVGSSHKRD